MRWIAFACLVLLLSTGLTQCVFTDPVEDCMDAQECGGPYPGGMGGGVAGSGGQGGQGGQGGGTGGTGIDPCGGCGGSTPYCDEVNGTCVACFEHAHCTEADAAQCDSDTCVPCTDHPHCAGVADAGICETGTCVQCTVDDDGACGGTETCNLADFICVGVAAGSVGNCGVCTNDDQCEADHRCIPMQFEQAPHGHYCLKDASGGCEQPFGNSITAVSINGAPSATHCGIEEDLATCEAVLALLAGWVCSGNSDSCGPQGQPEVAVPGALCRQVDTLADRCTYACATGLDCPVSGPPSSCGHSGGTTPDWCGG